jgi:hypothetical protein
MIIVFNLIINVFLEMNVEIANGLFFNGGFHCGEVSYPIDYKNFNYGKQTFTGTLITKKRWNARPMFL